MSLLEGWRLYSNLGVVLGAGIFVIGAWIVTLRAYAGLATRRMRAAVAKETALREAAEASNRANAEFLASMSHEIRTPMNAIAGFTELALRMHVSPELREYLGTVRTSAQWLMHVVNDVLEFSRVETSGTQLEDTRFSVGGCIQSAIKTIEPEAAAKGLTISCKLDSQIPLVLRGDPARLRQVMFNLLENAVKYTKMGGVTVTATLESRSTDAVLVRISVTDTGAGIALSRQEQIFEPLELDKQANGIRVASAGLGLAIARKLVRRMGGTIEVKSELGTGSTFEFTAWFRKAAKPAASDGQGLQSTATSQPLSILIAEDNALSRRLAMKLLQSAGHRVTETANGREVVELCSREIFDLILMDIEMPETNGFEATERIRKGNSLNSHVPIYALTAHALAGDRERCLAAGMDGYISKPIEVEAVLKIVSQIASRQAEPETVSAA
jgi:signal transduction histidine kinase/ActR/RegA family two-component response regulator